MKIAFGMIVLNGDFVLKQCLESVYPFANQILIAEGPVKYWQTQCINTSIDNTNNIIDNFPDPDKKIKIVHSQYDEKDDQCNAYIKHMSSDNDYLWNLDSDEIFKKDDISKLIDILSRERYTSVGFKSYTFYGGFEYCMGGFERNYEFLRIYKVYPGSRWMKHRPPKVVHKSGTRVLPDKHLGHDLLNEKYGINMYHYSYVFPRQVYNKLKYYESAVIKKGQCIPDYFNNIYLKWVKGDKKERAIIENSYKGLHEFMPPVRGDARSYKFNGTHPDIILRDMKILQDEFDYQLLNINELRELYIDE